MRSSLWFFVLVACEGSGLGEQRQAAFAPVEDSAFRADLVDLAAAQGEWFTAEVEVPAGAPVFVVSAQGGSGDADLYVRRGAAPTAVEFDCRSWADGNTERCEIQDPEPGTWTIGLRGYTAFEGVRVDWDVVLPAPVPPGPTPGPVEPMVIGTVPTTDSNQPCLSIAGIASRHGVLEAHHSGGRILEIAYGDGSGRLCRGDGACSASFPITDTPLRACALAYEGSAGVLSFLWYPASMLHDVALPATTTPTEREVVVPEGALALLAEVSGPVDGGRVEILRGDIAHCVEDAEEDCAIDAPTAGTYRIRSWHPEGARLRVSVVQ